MDMEKGMNKRGNKNKRMKRIKWITEKRGDGAAGRERKSGGNGEKIRKCKG